MQIEWRHLDLGETCGRCSDTGANLWAVITELGQEHLLDNVELELENTILPLERMDESNVVLINGVPIEHIIGAGVTFRGCSSCHDKSGQENQCPDAESGRDFFKALPAEMLRAAILKVLIRD
jgi:hypothetical protein